MYSVVCSSTKGLICLSGAQSTTNEPPRLARTNFDPNPLVLPETRLLSLSPFPIFFTCPFETIEKISRHWSAVILEYFPLTDC